MNTAKSKSQGLLASPRGRKIYCISHLKIAGWNKHAANVFFLWCLNNRKANMPVLGYYFQKDPPLKVATCCQKRPQKFERDTLKTQMDDLLAESTAFPHCRAELVMFSSGLLAAAFWKASMLTFCQAETLHMIMNYVQFTDCYSKAHAKISDGFHLPGESTGADKFQNLLREKLLMNVNVCESKRSSNLRHSYRTYL